MKTVATSKEFSEYAMEQLRDVGNVSCRKMFGEYGWYCDGKFMGVICDDQLFVKITLATEKAFPDIPKAPPYDGAKKYFLIEDIDNRELLTKLAWATYEALLEPKPKTRKDKHGV